MGVIKKELGYLANDIKNGDGIIIQEINLGEFSKLCEKNNIKQEYSRTGDEYKTSPIESFNRTVRSMFEKYKIVNKVNASNIFNVMKQINKKYNNSYHSVLKATPQEIEIMK